MSNQNIFSFHISILKISSIWPNSNILLSVIPFFCSSYGGFAAISGIIYLISQSVNDTTALIGCAVGLADYLGYMYARWCVRSCIPDIMHLMDIQKLFGKFYPNKEFVAASNKISKFAKIFFLYAIVGNAINNILALYDGNTCNEGRDEQLKKRDPCGIIARGYCFFDVDKFPVFHLYYLLQVVGCFTITVGILMSAMLQISMVQYIIHQLSYCRTVIKDISLDEETKRLKKRINLIVEYHVNIIMYSKEIEQAFSKMLLLHLTLTSLVISVLGFLILTSNNLAEVLRHCLHLCGWIILLSLTCYYGQLLIDESESISADIYDMPWYLADPSVQKDIQMIIRRAQDRLKITCAGVGEMSLSTFLSVMQTAYSYLTLFFKLKG